MASQNILKHHIQQATRAVSLTLGLLIVRGTPNEAGKAGVFYYAWEGQELKQLAFTPKEWPQ